jgi:hypothetical protein
VPRHHPHRDQIEGPIGPVVLDRAPDALVLDRVLQDRLVRVDPDEEAAAVR